MARAFRHVGAGYVAELDPAEARLVITLARDVLQMLSQRDGAPLMEVPPPGGDRFGGMSDWGIAQGGAAGRHRASRRSRRGNDAASRRDAQALPDDGGSADAVGHPAAEGTGADETGPTSTWPASTGQGQASPGQASPGQASPGRNDAEPVSPDRWWEELGLTDPFEAAGDLSSPEASERRRARPDDPALARLLPDLVAAADDDADDADRLRALTEDQVLGAKRAGLEEAVRLLAVDPLRVPESSAARFGAALNDIRLVLSQRLGIETEEDARRVSELEEDREDEVAHFMAVLYSFVSWLQESLMTALLKRR